jgi:hypothetical protein
MNHFVSLVMTIVSVIALAIFYRRATVFFAGLIVTGIPGILKLPLPGYNKIIYKFVFPFPSLPVSEYWSSAHCYRSLSGHKVTVKTSISPWLNLFGTVLCNPNFAAFKSLLQRL